MNSQRNVTFWVGALIVVVAGVWTIVHLIWNFASQTADDYWGIALLILFALALILSFVQYARERSTLKAAAANERFPEPSISRFFSGFIRLVGTVVCRPHGRWRSVATCRVGKD